MNHFRELADTWRTEADQYRRRGMERAAEMLDSVADDLERRVREWWMEPLTLEQAATESGVSYSTMQKRVASGEIANAGEPGTPRVLRMDLPVHDVPELREAGERSRDALTAHRKAG